MKPFVSVLIPAYNEEHSIGRCLESMILQSYPSERFEVIVMDNGSVDKTREIASRFGVRVLDAAGLRIGGVRNLGAKESKGDVLAFIDADCVAPSDWLYNGVKTLLGSDRIGAVGGQCSVPSDGTWIQKAWGWKKPISKDRIVNILSTGSFFIEKSTFSEVGCFNGNIIAGEDTELSRKLVESERMLVLSSSVGVLHLGYPSTLKDFLRRQIWQSSDYVKSKKSKKDPIFILVHIYLLLFLLGILTLPFEAARLFSFLMLTGTVVLALLLTLFRHVKNGRKFRCTLLLQCAILNYCYLAGRSVGLIKSYFRLLVRKVSLVQAADS